MAAAADEEQISSGSSSDAEASGTAALTSRDDSLDNTHAARRAPVLLRPSRTATPTERPRTSLGLAPSQSQSQHRRSYQETVPALPAIPARFLRTGRPASISGPPASFASPGPSRRDVSKGAEIIPGVALRVDTVRGSARGSCADDERVWKPETRRTSWNVSNGLTHAQLPPSSSEDRATPSPSFARRKSLPAIATGVSGGASHKREAAQGASGTEDMARRGGRHDEDLFLALAQDNEDDGVRASGRDERAPSRLSQAGKRRSLPPTAPMDPGSERRPKSSGNVFPRSASRLSGFPSDLQRHVDRYRQSPGRAEDVASVSGRSVSGRAGRFGSAPEAVPASTRLAERMRSPDLPSFGRRRPSYGAPLQAQTQRDRQMSLAGKAHDSQDESPIDSSEPKPDSASIESTADTVWDELDELKSRIKKLEWTGKAPPTSGAGASGDSSDRPRTATTAPTTVEPSPKHERKPSAKPKPSLMEPTVGGPTAANIHPLLHAALAKAKPLLNAPLYRSLEATAADALQLAAMTGSAGPQGTTFSAASIINGVTVSDRHVRRKADTMCRNLTDLTLALCEGKHAAPAVAAASPIVFEPLRAASSLRPSRSRMGRGGSPGGGPAERPMSRLEARRTSILGLPPTGNSVNGGSSVRGHSTEDVSASEHESTPSHAPPPPSRRVSRAGSRLPPARMPRYGEDGSGDEDPTIRPPSRAMTDIGGLRARATKPPRASEHESPGQPASESPGLRSGMLAARRSANANAGAFESNRDRDQQQQQQSSRVVSLNADAGRQRRWGREATPPVLEEEMGDAGEFRSPSATQQQQQPPRRRITSLGGQFSGGRRGGVGGEPQRTGSLSLGLRRGVVAEHA
ncbi:hypothetical protein LTR53_015946 [Teratosphaeriaceae sp. CCFEE 6253]|nr:hypothetical protein LTR53_015946 [Teratosphaeriaceae sp. CCFEE 6253]